MRIESAASLCVVGTPLVAYGVHSSNCITTSEFSTFWICIDTSGDRNSLSPLIGDANVTPSSVILRRSPSENTWKPPESVRIGLFQPMKPCRPPCASIVSRPGRSHRWNVLPRMIWALISCSSRGWIAFTVPYVPTGMKIGVSTTPWLSFTRPRRAWPSVVSSSNSSPFAGRSCTGRAYRGMNLRSSSHSPCYRAALHGTRVTAKALTLDRKSGACWKRCRETGGGEKRVRAKASRAQRKTGSCAATVAARAVAPAVLHALGASATSRRVSSIASP